MFRKFGKREHFSQDYIIKSEDRFIEAYMAEDPKKIRALRLLFKLYKGHYGRLFLAALVYIIKD